MVVAILTLLLSLLAPSLRRAKHITQVTICISNMHQVVAGGMAYASVNGGYLPQGVTWGWEYEMNAKVGDGGAGLFPRFISDPKAFYCPNAVWDITWAWNRDPSDRIHHILGYWVFLAGATYIPPNPAPAFDRVNLGTLGVPSDTMGVTCWGEGLGVPTGAYAWYQGGAQHYNGILPEGFMDGRARAVPREELYYDGCPWVEILHARTRPYIGQTPALHWAGKRVADGPPYNGPQ